MLLRCYLAIQQMWTAQVEADGLCCFSESYCTIHMFTVPVPYTVCVKSKFIFSEKTVQSQIRLEQKH